MNLIKNCNELFRMSFLSKGSKLIKSVGVLNKNIIITPVRNVSVSLARLNEYEYKAELTVKQMNNDNPFDTYVMKPEPGRGLMKKTPILIPSMSDSRWVFDFGDQYLFPLDT